MHSRRLRRKLHRKASIRSTKCSPRRSSITLSVDEGSKPYTTDEEVMEIIHRRHAAVAERVRKMSDEAERAVMRKNALKLPTISTPRTSRPEETSAPSTNEPVSTGNSLSKLSKKPNKLFQGVSFGGSRAVTNDDTSPVQLSPEQVTDLARKKFKQFDDDNSGDLDRLEFKRLLRAENDDTFETKEFRQLAKREFDKVDVDNSKRIDLEEFTQFFKDNQNTVFQRWINKQLNAEKPQSEVAKGTTQYAPLRVTSALYNGSQLSQFITRGDLKGLQQWVDDRMLSRSSVNMTCFGGIPAVVVAAYFKKMDVLEFLLQRPDLDTTLTPGERDLVLAALKRKDFEEVHRYLDSKYHESMARCELMTALSSQDIAKSREQLKKQKLRRQLNFRSMERPAPKPTSRLGGESSSSGRTVSVVTLGGEKSVLKQDSALLKAAARGDILAVRKALSNGASINCEDDNNVTPLLHATSYGESKLVAELLKYGADAMHQDLYRRTSMKIAAINEDIESIKLLAQHGGGKALFIKDGIGKVAIDWAKKLYTKEHIHTYMNETRMAKEDPPVDEDSSQPKPAMAKKHNTIYSLTGRDVHRVMDVLSQAAREGDLEYLQKRSREDRHNVLSKDRYSLTPLMHAAANGQLETVKLLLTLSPDPTEVSNLKNTALHFAYESGKREVVSLMLKRGGFREVKGFRNAFKKTPGQYFPRR